MEAKLRQYYSSSIEYIHDIYTVVVLFPDYQRVNTKGYE